MKRYIVELSDEEREQLRTLVEIGRAAAYKITHANVLLKVDQTRDAPAWPDEKIADAFSCAINTVKISASDSC